VVQELAGDWIGLVEHALLVGDEGEREVETVNQPNAKYQADYPMGAGLDHPTETSIPPLVAGRIRPGDIGKW
jgi:hypothetical protein